MPNEVQVITDNFSIDSLTAGSKERAVKASDASSNRSIFAIVPDKIVVLPEFNIRPKNTEYTAKVREIANSIIENGFYQHKPIACIVIKQNGVDVIACFDGHTRLDAVKLAISEGHQIEQVFISVAPAGTTLEDITIGLVTNNSGRQLEPMAIGLVCKRLQGYGLDNTKIAKRLGFSLAYVGQLFELIGSDRKIRDLVNEGKISATLAVSTIRDAGEGAADALQSAVDNAAAQGKSKATAKHLKPVNKPKKQADKKDVLVQLVQDNQVGQVTPFDAVVVQEALIQSETSMQNKGIEWLKSNVGIADHSHYELLIAVTGMSIEDIKSMLE